MRSALLGFVLIFSTQAWAGPNRAAVLDVLNQYDDAVSPKDLAKMDGVDAELMALADDAEVPESRKARAIWALGHFPSPKVKSFLTNRLADGSAPSIERRKAAWALAIGFGDDAMESLGKALGDNDKRLRQETAKALGKVGSKQAQDLLEKQLRHEHDAHVKDAIRAQLKE